MLLLLIFSRHFTELKRSHSPIRTSVRQFDLPRRTVSSSSFSSASIPRGIGPSLHPHSRKEFAWIDRPGLERRARGVHKSRLNRVQPRQQFFRCRRRRTRDNGRPFSFASRFSLGTFRRVVCPEWTGMTRNYAKESISDTFYAF